MAETDQGRFEELVRTFIALSRDLYNVTPEGEAGIKKDAFELHRAAVLIAQAGRFKGGSVDMELLPKPTEHQVAQAREVARKAEEESIRLKVELQEIHEGKESHELRRLRGEVKDKSEQIGWLAETNDRLAKTLRKIIKRASKAVDAYE